MSGMVQHDDDDDDDDSKVYFLLLTDLLLNIIRIKKVKIILSFEDFFKQPTIK